MFSDRRLGPGARALLLAAGLVFATWQLPALAQSADPSGRIATVTDAAGNLSFAPAGSDDWAAAALNRPITTGDRLWVDNGGRAELHAGSTAIRLGSGTAVTVLNLDDSATQVKLTQGTLQLRVRALPPDQPVEVDTPNLAFVPSEPGDYRLDVAPDGTSTVVTMHHGTAVVYGDNHSLVMRRGDQIRFDGADLAQDGSASNPPMDAFDRWAVARDAREDGSRSARYVPREMTGSAELDSYGDWQEDPGYGAVWFPRVVAADWAPYSAGHWAWVAPWGWSWCDDAPWGFAPFHYGRWARVGERWGWMPGPVEVRPVYAPALVGFIGGGGWNASIQIGNGPGVAWYPLGPREAYRPVYGASPTYITRINNVAVNNVTINNNVHNTYINRDVPGAITAMPARAFVQGQRVPPGARNVAWRDLPRGEANGAPPLAPVKASLVGPAPARPAPAAAMQGFARPAIAARPPGRPASDELAQRFARAGGTVPGAGPVWQGRGNGPAAIQAAPAPVRLSQAAQANHGRNAGGQVGGPAGGSLGNPGMAPQRVEGGIRPPMPQGLAGEHGAQPPVQGIDPRTRGWTTRPNQAGGTPPQNGQPAAPLQQAQPNGRGPQPEPQGMARAQPALQQQQDMQRQQQRQAGDQQHAQQALQQQQEMQRQQQQRQAGDQQRAQQAAQQQAMQQQAQQRQMQEQQRQQQAMQRQMQEQQRAQQAAQQQAMQQQAQQRQQQQQQQQMQEQQRQQQVMQRQQQQEQQQRQQQDQQRQQQEQQKRQQELQRQQQHAAQPHPEVAAAQPPHA